MKYRRFCSIFITLLLCISCSLHTKETKNLLDQAENILEEHPDSACSLLETIYYPSELKPDLHAEYALLLLRAKNKSDRDISNDTLIFQARDYFQSIHDFEQTAKATFYAGRVYEAQKDYTQAIKEYLKAETISGKLKDNDFGNNYLKGLIQSSLGDAYYRQNLFTEAIERYRFAMGSFGQSSSRRHHEINLSNTIGSCFFLLNKQDSALYYYNHSMNLAEIHHDTLAMIAVKHNLGSMLFKIGKINQAKEQLSQTLSLRSESKTGIPIKTCIYLLEIFRAENQTDSVVHYSHLLSDLLTKEEDPYTLLTAYTSLSNVEEKAGNYPLALDYQKKRMQSFRKMYEEKEKNDLVSLQKKYDFELLKGINNRLIIQRQWIVIILFVLSIVIILMSFLFYHHQQQNKVALAEAKQAIYQLKEMVNNADNAAHAFVVKQFDIVKKISLLEGYLMEEEREKGKTILKKVNKIIYERDNFEWDVLYQAMNHLHKGYFDKIKSLFPNLLELEYKICCLTKSGLNNTEIGILIQANANVVQMKKTAIRKKLGIREFGDIVAFMDEAILPSF